MPGAKGEAKKVKPAQEFRAETTLPLAKIARRVRMATRGYLAWLLRQGSTKRR